MAGFHDWTIEGVHLCVRAAEFASAERDAGTGCEVIEDVSKLKLLDNAQLRELGRLPYPMLREKSAKGFRRISWEDAYRRIANKIRAITPKHWAIFVTSRGVTNEVYYMAQKAARFLGTNNVDNAARICHSPSTAAMKYALGVAASTCSYKDWYGTNLIIFFGANPANDQPVTTKYLHEAKALGTKIVMVNPYREPGMERYWVPSNLKSAVFGTDLADYWFPVSTGGDIAFLGGVLKILIENNSVDENFIRNHSGGFNELKSAIDRWPMETLETQSGLNRAAMREFAELIRDAKTGVLVWSMGITQHAFGGDTVSMILNLGLLRGWVGRDKCGLMPIRGHSSVQGGAEMGAYATAFPGGKPINAEKRRAPQLYGFPCRIDRRPQRKRSKPARGRFGFVLLSGRKFLRTLQNRNMSAPRMFRYGASGHHSHRPDVHRGERGGDPAPSQNALRAGRRRH